MCNIEEGRRLIDSVHLKAESDVSGARCLWWQTGSGDWAIVGDLPQWPVNDLIAWAVNNLPSMVEEIERHRASRSGLVLTQ